MDIDNTVIESAIKSYYKDRYDITDNKALCEYIENSKQSIFNASLTYANNFIGLNAKLKNQYDGINAYTINSYNYNRCIEIAYIYIDLCDKYNKVSNVHGYSKLTGIDNVTLNEWSNDRKVSNSYKNIIKIISCSNESMLSDLLLEPRNNIGVIAVLNHNYNWSNSTVIHEHRLTTNSDKQSLQSKYSQYIADNTNTNT